MRMTVIRMTAASATRATTTVKTGNSLTAIPLKKKDPPHNSESARSISHSRADMMVTRSLPVSFIVIILIFA